ncbi:MAG: hypothetical protein HQK66_08500 [Desulfamplus sp.]|nr:hypothetical protein [Desulfamplus sp.]
MLAEYIKDIGRKEGKKEGEKEGRKEGEKEGRKEGRKEASYFFVKKAAEKGIPKETIAEILNIDKQIIIKIINNEIVDVPLHLLDDMPS